MTAAVLFMLAPIAVLAFAAEMAAQEERLRRDRLARAARKRARSQRPWQPLRPVAARCRTPACGLPMGCDWSSRTHRKQDGSFPLGVGQTGNARPHGLARHRKFYALHHRVEGNAEHGDD